ncbi:hypothetical protein ACFFQW_45075 [Umezawaea endophytica]|uniref:Uncharacterized protein n=1 Tax=Umezawaea endophytica TaxID=1654476 RepID=A0A9X2VXZ0_9PSEU|nr:hypothetical protein [Umezawaea endophytica]MCS7484676.1 hypothetical protein [Umezawaea endophytica]
MFENSAQDSPDLVKVCDPVELVWVDLGKAHRPEVPSDTPPELKVRNRGLVLSGTVQGELRAWVRSARGTWYGLVDYAVPWFAFGTIPVRQLVPRAALAKRRPGEVEPPF